MSDTVGGEQPRAGTLAWVQAHDLIERDGVMLPSCHRIPEDASLAPASESVRCRVVLASGERCKGTRLLAYGLCMGHAGGGGTRDLPAMQERSRTAKRQIKVTKQVLGIGPRRSADPRAFMRLRAAQRADELARAVVDGPLDDAKLGSMDRQRAALAALDASFPLATASLTLEIPDDPEDMDWESMQAVALSLES